MDGRDAAPTERRNSTLAQSAVYGGELPRLRTDPARHYFHPLIRTFYDTRIRYVREQHGRHLRPAA